MAVFWFISFIVLLFIELITVNLVSIWFAIGACFALCTSIFTDNIIIQLVVWIVVSIISLILTKPIMKKFKEGRVEPTNLDRVIGKTGVVTKDITSNNYGEVKVLGSVWTANSTKPITTGKKIIVKKIDGVKLIVEEE